MQSLELKLFAGFHLLDFQGNPVAGISRKAKALLAWLALNSDKEYPREKIASMLWPDRDESQARHSLRQALSDLRKTLPKPVLHTAKDWVLLDSEQIQIDALCFNKALKEGSDSALDHAIQLYQGELLEGCNPRSDAFDDWLYTYRSHYNERVVIALEQRIKGLLDSRQYQQAIFYATRLLSLDELNEPAYRALMLAHLKLGQYGNAISWFNQCDRTLQDTLGVAPNAELQTLNEKIISSQGKSGSSNNRQSKGCIDPSRSANQRSILNSDERLLYHFDMALRGALEFSIGHSFLIRSAEKQSSNLAKDIVERVIDEQFVYCHQKVVSGEDHQTPLASMVEALNSYLLDPKRLDGIKYDTSIKLKTLSILNSLEKQKPVLMLFENIQHSEVDLMVQLAELAAHIGNHPMVLMMTGDVGDSEPMDIIWQNSMIGAPLTTIDL